MVINSRLQKKLNQTWRRRRCESCQGIFTTLEGVDWYSSIAVKKDTVLEPFSRDKLLVSIIDSLKHRKTATEDASSLTSTIIGKLYSYITDAALDIGSIRQITTETLKHFDHVAYVHYSAYHPSD